jgi:hypothetical protein
MTRTGHAFKSGRVRHSPIPDTSVILKGAGKPVASSSLLVAPTRRG